MKYTYKRLTIDSYIHTLYEDGLQHSSVLSADEIRNRVESIGIFRLKGYVKAFRNGLNAYSIDDLLELHDIDRQISSSMFILSSQVEIKLKAYLIEVAYEQSDNPFFYLLKENYKEDFRLNSDSLNDWKIPKNSLKPEVYMHYRDYYLSTYSFGYNRVYIHEQETIELCEDVNYPPFHYFVENLALGAVIMLVSKLRLQNKSVLKLVGNKFGIYNEKTFLHYLLRLKEIRNRCAHNGRLFNRNYRGVKSFGKHKEFRKIIYEHKLIDVYYSLQFLKNSKNIYAETDELISSFINDNLSKCSDKIQGWILNILRRTR